MKIETKTTHNVNHNNFDRAVQEFLKSKGAKRTDFEIASDHEMGNDTCASFTVGEHDWSKIDEEQKQEILNGKLYYCGGDILQWMHEEGLVPAGEYIVKISW